MWEAKSNGLMRVLAPLKIENQLDSTKKLNKLFNEEVITTLLQINSESRPMTHFDPLYGELLTSREVSDMTGLTMNQLRNYRQTDRIESAPFGFVRIGGAVYYRKVVIQAYINLTGSAFANRVYVQTDLDKQFPLSGELESNEDKREQLIKLGAITTANAWTKWYQWYSDIRPESAGSESKQWREEFWQLIDPVTPYVAPTRSQRGEYPEQYYLTWTYAMRKAYASVYKFGITDAEIMALPSGSVPPEKEETK